MYVRTYVHMCMSMYVYVRSSYVCVSVYAVYVLRGNLLNVEQSVISLTQPNLLLCRVDKVWSPYNG